MAIRPFGVADIDFRLCICQTHHNHFNSEQIGISPCQLSLHAAGGRTADQVLFDAHEHDDHGDDGKTDAALPATGLPPCFFQNGSEIPVLTSRSS